MLAGVLVRLGHLHSWYRNLFPPGPVRTIPPGPQVVVVWASTETEALEIVRLLGPQYDVAAKIARTERPDA